MDLLPEDPAHLGALAGSELQREIHNLAVRAQFTHAALDPAVTAREPLFEQQPVDADRRQVRVLLQFRQDDTPKRIDLAPPRRRPA